MTAQLGEPRYVEPGLLMLAGLAKRYTPDKLSFLPIQWAELRSQLGFFHGRLGDKMYGVWSDVLSGGKIFSYFAGVAVGEYCRNAMPYSLTGERFRTFEGRRKPPLDNGCRSRGFSTRDRTQTLLTFSRSMARISIRRPARGTSKCGSRLRSDRGAHFAVTRLRAGQGAGPARPSDEPTSADFREPLE
jgi:hypothetical protein